MANDTFLPDRLKFMRIDDEVRGVLAEITPVLERELPAVLDGFYAHIKQWPETGGKFND